MTSFSLLLAALSVVSPAKDATVATLKDAQRAYFANARTVRVLRMDNPADRAKLFAAGATQKPLKLEWTGAASGPVELEIDFAEGGERQCFSISNSACAYITNLELARRYIWRVTDSSGATVSSSFETEATPPRFLRADGVGNFRDLGGWMTASGRRVRQNRVFRSAGLRFSTKNTGGVFRRRLELGARRVTAAGLATLTGDFKIKTDLELRTKDETAGMETTLLGPEVRWVNVSFAAYGFIDNMVRGREPFVKLFREFTKEENYPILMHCSGGRDRTGTLAFLLNGLLGVSEEDLRRDWEASIFSDQGEKFTSDRIEGLFRLLNAYPGETINEKIEFYVKSCGISSEEIAAFRALMLE